MKFTVKEAAPGHSDTLYSVSLDNGKISTDKPEALEGIDVDSLSPEQAEPAFYWLMGSGRSAYTAVEAEGTEAKYQFPDDFDPAELPRTGSETDEPDETDETVSEETLPTSAGEGKPAAKPAPPKVPERLTRRGE